MFRYWNEAREIFEQELFAREQEIYNMLRIDNYNNVRFFLKNHTFLLGFLDQRQADVITLRYGLNGNKTHILNDIANKYSISRERVRQIITSSLRSLRFPSRVRLAALFTDDELTSNEVGNLSPDQIDLIYRRKLASFKIESLNNKSKEYLKFRRYLDIILETSIVYFDNTAKNIQIKDVLMMEEKDALNINIINLINKLGLKSPSDYEYEEDWIDDCVESLMQRGDYYIAEILNVENLDKDAFKDFESIMAMKIEELQFSNKLKNGFERCGIDTIYDIISLTRKEFMEIKFFGDNALNEIAVFMKRYNLDFRPKNLDVLVWRKELGKKYGVEFSTFKLKKIPETIDILDMSIDELELSVRAYNALKRSDINLVQDLVSLTQNQLLQLRTMGPATVNEICEKLKAKNLKLRVEGEIIDKWLKKLRAKLNESNNQKRLIQERLDIYEIPEKYRRIYAIGAGVEAERQIKEKSLSETVINKALDKIRHEEDDLSI